MSLTSVLQDELDVENGDDFALSLTDVHIAIHTLDLADLRLDIAILDLKLGEVVIEPLPGPRRDVLVHPVPVVGVVQNHCGIGGFGAEKPGTSNIFFKGSAQVLGLISNNSKNETRNQKWSWTTAYCSHQ